MKTEILNTILEIVSGTCEVSADELRSYKKTEPLVFARAMFVFACVRRAGIPSSDVAHFLTRKSNDCVVCCLYNHEAYTKQSMLYRQLCQQVKTKLMDKLPEIYD